VPQPGASGTQKSTEKLKTQKPQVLIQFQQKLLKQQAGKLVLISTSLLIICGNVKELPEQWNSQSWYLHIRKVITQSAGIF
jgi:hypothetical protein